MGGINTGELYSQEEFNAMTENERERIGMVPITPAQSALLEPMSKEDRMKWLKKNKSKKPTRKQLNKRERQNRKKGRS
jgi:hypothetical protein